METLTMSSNEAPATIVCGWLITLVICGQFGSGLARADEAIVCPTDVKTSESAQAAGGWSVEGATAVHAFERISVYNAGVDRREFDLAPDEDRPNGKHVVQVWHLQGYRTLPVFLKCRYRNTPVVLTRELPPRIKTCTLKLLLDRGKIVGDSTMECR